MTKEQKIIVHVELDPDLEVAANGLYLHTGPINTMKMVQNLYYKSLTEYYGLSAGICALNPILILRPVLGKLNLIF